MIAVAIPSYILVGLSISVYASWKGYAADAGAVKWEVRFPAAATLYYTSYSPERAHAVVDRPEIQGAVARLIGNRQIVQLSSMGVCIAPERFREWSGTLEALCFYRRKWLRQEVVSQILTEMSALCESIEQVGHSDQLFAVPRPAKADGTNPPFVN